MFPNDRNRLSLWKPWWVVCLFSNKRILTNSLLDPFGRTPFWPPEDQKPFIEQRSICHVKSFDALRQLLEGQLIRMTTISKQAQSHANSLSEPSDDNRMQMRNRRRVLQLLPEQICRVSHKQTFWDWRILLYRVISSLHIFSTTHNRLCKQFQLIFFHGFIF